MDPESAVTATLDAVVAAWNAGDADAYGALFSEDATYVTFTGIAYRGRAAITEAHRALFATHLKGVKLAQQVLDVRSVAPDVAVAVTRGDTYRGTSPGRGTKAQTHVLARRADRWEVVAFHNTKRHPLLGRLTARNPVAAGNLGPKSG